MNDEGVNMFLFAVHRSSSLAGVGTIKYPLMAPHRSSHPASGLPGCVSIARCCVLFPPCVFHWCRVYFIGRAACVVSFICRLVVFGRVGSQAWRGCGSSELESGGWGGEKLRWAQYEVVRSQVPQLPSGLGNLTRWWEAPMSWQQNDEKVWWAQYEVVRRTNELQTELEVRSRSEKLRIREAKKSN